MQNCGLGTICHWQITANTAKEPGSHAKSRECLEQLNKLLTFKKDSASWGNLVRQHAKLIVTLPGIDSQASRPEDVESISLSLS
jgi:hypothetical protein